MAKVHEYTCMYVFTLLVSLQSLLCYKYLQLKYSVCTGIRRQYSCDMALSRTNKKSENLPPLNTMVAPLRDRNIIRAYTWYVLEDVRTYTRVCHSPCTGVRVVEVCAYEVIMILVLEYARVLVHVYCNTSRC